MCKCSHNRKNFLFCDTVHGANASANLYLLIETAKASGIEPYAYIGTLFTELPNATSVKAIEALLQVPAREGILIKTAGMENPLLEQRNNESLPGLCISTNECL